MIGIFGSSLAVVGCPYSRPGVAGAYPQIPSSLMFLGEKVKIVRGHDSKTCDGSSGLSVKNSRTKAVKETQIQFGSQTEIEFELSSDSIPDISTDSTAIDKFTLSVMFLPVRPSESCQSSIAQGEFGLVLDHDAIRVPAFPIPVFSGGGVPGGGDS